MRIEKDSAAIASLAEWQERAGPKDPARQWVAGGSAMEAARAWLEAAPAGPPEEIGALLRSHADFGDVVVEHVEPEARVSFETRRGEPRSADLAFVGHDARGPLVGTIETRTDEPFGPRFADVIDAALEHAVAHPRSGSVEQVVELVRALVPPRVADTVSIGELRLRLLMGVAGSLALAAQHHAPRAIFILHVVETATTAAGLRAANANDASQFVRRLSSGVVRELGDGNLVGPIQVRGAALAAKPAALYIGMATRRVPAPPA